MSLTDNNFRRSAEDSTSENALTPFGGVRPLDWKDLVVTGALVWGCLIVLMWNMDAGVVPHDEGTLGHSAERILNGEVPHRDLHSLYSGLLSQVHALSFRLFGINLISMRYILMIFAACFIAGLYVILRKACSPPAAALAVIVAYMWSLPNYFAPMPTWYNLFFTTFGLLALVRDIELGRMHWLVLAGVCAGISFLFKSVGAYFWAATALFLVYRAQLQSLSPNEEHQTTTPSPAIGSLPMMLGLLLPAAFVVAIFGVNPRLPEFLVLALPPLLVTGLLGWREWQLRHTDSVGRLCRVCAQLAAFLGGIGLPVGLFLAYFAARGALGDWYQGVFVTPQQRLHQTEMSREINSEAFEHAVLVMLLLGPFVWLGLRYSRFTKPITVSLAIVLGMGIYLGSEPQVYPAVWESIRLLPLVFTMGMFWRLARPRGRSTHRDAEGPAWQKTYLIVATAAWFAMVQYPITHGIYMLYAAPLLVAAGAYMASQLPASRRWPVVVIGVFLVVYSGQWVMTNFSPYFGDRYSPPAANVYLDIDRGQVRYDPLTANIYEALVGEIRRRTPKNSYILAMPDCPEVYFLSGRKNPTPTFFDAFDDDYGTLARDQRLLRLVDEYDVNLIVLRNLVSVSTEALTPWLVKALAEKFPYEYHIRDEFNTIFLVRWREPSVSRSRNFAHSSRTD